MTSQRVVLVWWPYPESYFSFCSEPANLILAISQILLWYWSFYHLSLTSYDPQPHWPLHHHLGFPHLNHSIPSYSFHHIPTCQARGNALNSFEPLSLNYTTFAAALAKTFNLQFTPKELGYLVTLYDPQKSQEVVCKPFLTAFFALGSSARETMRQNQLNKQVDRSIEYNHLDLFETLSWPTTPSFLPLVPSWPPLAPFLTPLL